MRRHFVTGRKLPQEALNTAIRDRVIIAGRTFTIARPNDSDQFPQHPAVRSALAGDAYVPYWADLWPAARMMAKAVLRERWPPGLQVLEVGCGLGLPGIAALSMGLQVVFSDYDPNALRFAAANAEINGFPNYRLLQLDWRDPPKGTQFPVLLGSDLFYETCNVAPLVTLIKQVLASGGVCLLTDQDRPPSRLLRHTLTAERLPFTTLPVRAGVPGGQRCKGTLYRVSQPSG